LGAVREQLIERQNDTELVVASSTVVEAVQFGVVEDRLTAVNADVALHVHVVDRYCA